MKPKTLVASTLITLGIAAFVYQGVTSRRAATEPPTHADARTRSLAGADLRSDRVDRRHRVVVGGQERFQTRGDAVRNAEGGIR